MESFCDRHGIFLDVVPGEADWKIGTCEQAVKGVKEVMSKLTAADPEISCQEALATAIRTFNQRELVRGFSPVQHVLGHSPDVTGPVMDAMVQAPVKQMWEDPEGEFERSAMRRAIAESAHAEWNARQRIIRAQNSKGSPPLDVEPGELVFFWRHQTSQKGRQQPGDKKGRFVGPARVLAREPRINSDGTSQPGGTLWLVRGRSLLKCAVEQVRRASDREQLLEALADPADRTPWSFNPVAEEIGGNQFQDLTSQKPTLQEWLRAQDPLEEEPPVRYRFRGKRPAPVPVEEEFLEDAPDVLERASGSRPPRDQQRQAQGFEAAAAWWTTVASSSWEETESTFWAQKDAAVSVEVDTPTGHRGWQALLENSTAFFGAALKRKAVEVCEKHLTESQKQEFREAKQVKVRNFLAAQAFEALPAHFCGQIVIRPWVCAGC